MHTSRRQLLQVGLGSAAAIALSSSVPNFVSQFAYANAAANADISNDNVLVVVQLTGGNDGLNTVIPYRSDEYHKGRPYIAIKDKYHTLSDQLALNPGMGAFKGLFDEGRLAVVNGCGYPDPNRSHFRSMEIWQTAETVKAKPDGWLGHYIDHCLRGTDNPLKGVNVGSQLPQALVSDLAPVPCIQSLDDFRVRLDGAASQDVKLEEEIIRQLNEVRNQTPSLQFLSRQATNAIITADNLRKLQAYKPDVTYPYGLGKQLQLIAQLIDANMGTRIFYCQIGGFDTHANQPSQHQYQLNQVSESIAAFYKDLAAKGHGEKVAVMCFSEFGRRVAQNNSNGTDHGTAAPMFVVGGKVKGGLYGAYPSLSDLDSGDLKYTTDFRRVYATLLDKWLNVNSAEVLGNRFEPMMFL
ncbi:MAG TPA: DUF1501 domain-containing protein [Tepidisphaeraceae bacterium]|jgi:uncharacterized protein (DUF1501 family)|nr:DUF1501 domain-containing protein [Tepidisphaeraceae bacterium]